ncbi:hypothetical protein M8J75_015540 [Diaphorina citri]|nr:hypothetical protein M8J75_015540 [Diaphorina citri]
MKIDRGEGRGERRGGNIEVMELPSTFRPAVVSPMRPMCWVPPSPQPANLATQPRVVSHTRSFRYYGNEKTWWFGCGGGGGGGGGGCGGGDGGEMWIFFVDI